MIEPGGTIGIIGGGQLGRMLAMAAAQLGYRCHIYSPEDSGPATEVAAAWTRGAYDDGTVLQRFAAAVDVITYEFENIDVAPLETLSGTPLHPPPRALAIAQDRIAEKSFARDLGIATAPWMAVNGLADLAAAVAAVGMPSILKTARFGYDGKGQVRLRAESDATSAWAEIGRQPAILEGFVEFEQEFSVVAVRGQDGETRAWPAPENRHKDGILDTSTVPATGLAAEQVEAATAATFRLAEALGYVGVLAVEFFATPDGPVFNEMAPRVHNSGHWTIEGAVTSQFENHIRAVCGLPLGDASLVAGGAAMTNLIGDDVHRWRELLADPSAHLHLYGKHEAKPGRKMGHVTRLR